MRFIVEVREVWVRSVAVTADSKQEAIDKIATGEVSNNFAGEQVENGIEYSHTLGADTWTIAEDEKWVAACGNYQRMGCTEDQDGRTVSPESCYVCGMQKKDHQ